MRRKILGLAVGLSLLTACSSGQQASVSDSNVLPAQRADAQKCEHSGDLTVTPCHVKFSGKRRQRNIFVSPQPGSGSVGEQDDCQGIAEIADLSGGIWNVMADKVAGNCTARFTKGTSWAELKIDDDL
jgi:hypothetical protein